MIEKVIAGLVVTIVGALIVNAFKRKQLYLVVPRLFSNSSLSANGKLVEIRLFNKGRNSEVDIQIIFDPGVSYEIVASSDSTSSLTNTTINIPRIPPGDDYSVLLLVEGGDFSNERIASLSSSTTKGKVIKELGEVPPNAGNVILAIVAFMIIGGTPIAGIEGYSMWQESKKQEHLAQLTGSLSNAWEDIAGYAESEYSRNYFNGEFPIHLADISRKGKYVTIKFRIINKAAAPLELHATPKWPFKDEDDEPWNSTIFVSRTTPPATTEEVDFVLFWPKGKSDMAMISFNMSVGTEKYLSANTRIKIDI